MRQAASTPPAAKPSAWTRGQQALQLVTGLQRSLPAAAPPFPCPCAGPTDRPPRLYTSLPRSTPLHPPDLLYISRRLRMSVPALADERMPRSGAGGTAAAASNALPPSPPALAAVAVAWSASAASDAAAEGVSSPAKRTRGELWGGYGRPRGRKLWTLAGHMLAV